MEVQIFTWMMDIFFIFTLHILYRQVLGVKVKNKLLFVLGWCGCFLAWNVGSYLMHEQLLMNSICSLFINFCVAYLLYGGSVRTKAISVFVVVILGAVAEVIAGFTMEMMGMSVSEINQNSCIYFGSATSKIFCSIFVKIIATISRSDKNVKIEMSEWCNIIVIPVCSLIIIYTAERNNNFNIDVWKIVFFFNIFFVNIVTYYTYQKIQMRAQELIEQKMVAQQNQYYKLRYAETEKQWMMLRRMRHDMRNNYVLEMSYLESGKYDELKDLYENMIGDLKPESNVVSTGNIGIDSIVNFKLEMARELSIQIEPDIKIRGEVNIENQDVNVLFGNLLDNAIEAVENYEGIDKKIGLQIYSDETALLVRVSNPYENVIQEDEKGNVLTSKEDAINHGIGLKSIKEVVNRYNGDLKIEWEENIFKVTAFLYGRQEL